MKNPKLRTRLHVRRRIHSRYPDYSLQQFIETAGDVPEGLDPQEILAAIAEADDLWALIAEATGLKKRRDEVVEEIEKVRNRIVKPFEKKAKAVRK